MEELISNNPCVRFIVDNYDLLCRAHAGKVVMAMNYDTIIDESWPDAYIARTFASMGAAMAYTDAMAMKHVPYALKECKGGDPWDMLIWSQGCKES